MSPVFSTVTLAIPLLLALTHSTSAHVAAFAKGMYCLSGPTGDNLNSNTAVSPLYDLSFTDFWFQHDRGCDDAPPANGDVLNIPAGGTFTVELANNQAFTSLSYDGQQATDWPDGGDHPDDWHGPIDGGEGCIQDDGWIHTQNETSAQGTAWAIAYSNPSDLAAIKLDDLVVFSVLEHTPWKRRATYDVPADLEECPEQGCTCAWLWVPRGCGQPNVYMQGFRCRVVRPEGSGMGKPIAKARPPVYCEGEEEKCVKGAKQVIVWNQQEGVDNVVGVPEVFLAAPGYNSRCGFETGAQTDIFEEDEGMTSTAGSASSATASTTLGAGFSGIPGALYPSGSTGTTASTVSITATPADANHGVQPTFPTGSNSGSHSGSDFGSNDGVSLASSFPPAGGASDTSPSSFTSTMTGLYGRSTTLKCYIDED